MKLIRIRPRISTVVALLVAGVLALVFAGFGERFRAAGAAKVIPSAPVTLLVGQNSLVRPELVGPNGPIQFAYHSEVDSTGNLRVTLIPDARMLADTQYALRGTVVETIPGVSPDNCAAMERQRNAKFEFDGRKCLKHTERTFTFRTSKG